LRKCENVEKGLARFLGAIYYSPPRCKQRSASSEAAGDGGKKGACFKGAFLLPGSSGGFVLGCVSGDGVVEQLFADWDVSEVDLEISQTSLQKSA